jgi:hypothetical protein
VGDISWVNIIWAGIMVFFIIRLWPNAKQWIKHGPKGDSNDWTTFIVLIGGVGLFIAFLIYSVRG